MLNDYNQLVKGITTSPWLITQDGLATIVEVVNMRLEGKAFSDEEIRIRLEAADAKRDGERTNPRTQVEGGVGIVPLYGSIFPKSNLMTALSGATSLETFTSDLRELVADDRVKQVVIDIDSPGGVADMIPETGTLIKELSAVKPIYASLILWPAPQLSGY
jgi:ClpP class serine protease